MKQKPTKKLYLTCDNLIVFFGPLRGLMNRAAKDSPVRVRGLLLAPPDALVGGTDVTRR